MTALLRPPSVLFVAGSGSFAVTPVAAGLRSFLTSFLFNALRSEFDFLPFGALPREKKQNKTKL